MVRLFQPQSPARLRGCWGVVEEVKVDGHVELYGVVSCTYNSCVTYIK